jgi:hypothetical protein
MFIHFNMLTFVSGEWSAGKEDPLLFTNGEKDGTRQGFGAVCPFYLQAFSVFCNG